jgi:putative membrane protein
MHNLKQLSVGLFAAMALSAAAQLHANEAPAEGQISPRNFVEEASAKGVAEIETAKLALEKGTTDDVKEFAQTMVEDHTAANKELTALAQQKELEVSTEAELINKAKAMILQLRGEKSFDKAYMNNQVMAHQQTIELFQKAISAEDAEIAAFAQKTLPKLEHHLKMAEQINAQLPEQ